MEHVAPFGWRFCAIRFGGRRDFKGVQGVQFTKGDFEKLVAATGPKPGQPGWTYSDIRTRLYPAAMAKAFPSRALNADDLVTAASRLQPSPVMEDK